jgi:hypothetical protein
MRENYWNLEQTRTIKTNFELVATRTQLKRGTNEERISHIGFLSKKWVGITQTRTLKGSCRWGPWSPSQRMKKNV